ncbi:unannotated protein [freshwater metagenome]|uniref:Unannotated protein n=1 Tax=freshwater metagenome TaxID=449393 RepID=A0A6J7KPA7_9ZZZZ
MPDRLPIRRAVRLAGGAGLAALLLVVLVLVATGDDPGATRSAAATTGPAAPAGARATSGAALDAALRAARRPDRAVPSARTRRFDADRALRLVRLQVAAGPRPAGSAALARVRRQLVRRLPRAREEAVAGHPGLVNVVGRIPGRAPAIVLAAHYDTQLRPEGFVGANDSAAGTAAVLEAARALARQERPAGAREVRFVLFDGEELPVGGSEDAFARDGLRGSRAYAAAHADEVGALVLADYVAGRGLRLPRELGSDPGLWGRVRAAATRVGVGRVFAGTGVGIIDDHLPFVQAGVPAVDLIDWDYPQKNTGRDTLDRLSAGAMDATGETLVEWAATERRR